MVLIESHLAQEAWGETHDIFEMAKMEFYELKERLQATP
jgi:hypothetical protein